jgi:hypothetical protein
MSSTIDFLAPHPQTIVPAEDRGNVVTEDFTCIDTEDALLNLMNKAAASSRGIRVISSGWSWNKIITAAQGSFNVVFTGGMSTGLHVEPHMKIARVSGALQIADFVWYAKEMGLELEWPPKGMCYTFAISQTFAGFIATNVHHTWSPTSYDWVESFRLAVFIEGQAQIVKVSRDSRPELFESVFGGVGITGIIVEVELRLRESTKWDVTTEKGKLPYKRHWLCCPRWMRCAGSYSIESITDKLMLVSNTPDTMLYFETAEGRYEIRYVTPAAACPRATEEAVTTKEPAFQSCCECQAVRNCCKACCDAAVRCVKVACFLNPCYRCFSETAANIFTNRTYEDSISHEVEEGRCLSLYTAQSWFVGRPYLVTKEKVAMTGSVKDLDALDLSMFVNIADWCRFVDVAAPLIAVAPPLVCMLRFVPQAKGMSDSANAVNASNDCMAIEFIAPQGALFLPTSRWVSEFLNAICDAGIRLRVHPGKALKTDPVFRDSLTTKQRRLLNLLRTEYDPHDVFNGGEVKIEDMYNLSVI